ncbi:MAG TPA: hypothetical protein VNW05_06785 [Steroidobacteraceae bacterium]|jgi:hypothetical protein|nr:hypothetical protein [Steroidobacteraceae bacterium]
MLAERAVIGLNESAMRQVIRARQAACDGVPQMNYSNVGKTPAQSQRDDRNYGDHTEISELLSDGLMLLHFSTS